MTFNDLLKKHEQHIINKVREHLLRFMVSSLFRKDQKSKDGHDSQLIVGRDYVKRAGNV